MAELVVGWRDIEGLKQFSGAMRRVGSQFEFGNAARRAINHTGDKARTQVVRALARQTGLKQKLMRKAIKVHRARNDSFTYRMSATGGDISLKFFKPRELRGGVKARLPGGARTFASAFMRGGRWPNRVAVPAFHGHVFERTGSGRFPIEKIKSGVIIPREMVRGETAAAFNRTVRTFLPARFRHEMNRITGGAFS